MGKKLLFIEFFVLISCFNCFSEGIGVNQGEKLADWTLFVYMESDKELNDAVLKNITDMARSNVTGNINVVVQLHAWQETAWRYIISGNSISLDSIIELTLDPEQDLVNGLSWAFNKFPSKRVMTVLWNHGFGILDPIWSEHEESWVPEISQDSQRSRFRLITENLEHKGHKGVLFYPYKRLFLNNSGMVNAFNKVKNEILGGRKVDIISVDACKMAMVEIAYQLSDFADYLIGSQDCELKDGCDYYSLIKNLSLNLDPRDIAKNIVYNYENYYKPRAACGRYTQSAIDLNYIKDLVENLDNLIINLDLIKNSQDKENIFKITKKVRNNIPEFCSMPSYVDIYSFLSALKEEILLFNLENKTENILNILDTLNNCLLSLNKVTVANVNGFKSSHANGLSIYYPYEYADCSYLNCMFAQKSLWVKFLKSFAIN